MEVDTLPTAEEVFKKHQYLVRVETDSSFIENPVKRAMIEFAKMHVKAALEAAFDKGIVGIEGAFGVYWNRADLLLDRESILTAYPENLIK